MGTHEQTYSSLEIVEGVPVVGFIVVGRGENGPDETYSEDLDEFRGRMEALGESGQPLIAVVDFANYRMTGVDNGRALLGLLGRAQKRLVAHGGGLLVCNHPAQLNPDLQNLFHFDQFFDIYRNRREALDEAHSRRSS